MVFILFSTEPTSIRSLHLPVRTYKEKEFKSLVEKTF